MDGDAPDSHFFDIKVEPKRLYVVFRGHLDLANGMRSAGLVKGNLERGERDIVLDIRNMTGYDMSARQAWADALIPYKANISCIWVLGGSTFVRMGASALGLLIGVKFRLVMQSSEIPGGI